MHLVKVSKNTYPKSSGIQCWQQWVISYNSHQYIPLDFLYVHPWTLGICIVQKKKNNKAICSKSANFLTYYF